MRVITGAAKGRRLSSPRGRTIRPTSDRIKESIFGILGDAVVDAVVLDLFAGTGNLGIEALSRGARRAVFVEREKEALRLIQKNLAQCGMEDRSQVMPTDVLRAIHILEGRQEPFDIVFADPPYGKGWIEKIVHALSTHKLCHEGSTLLVQRDRRESLPESLTGWTLHRERRIGDTVLSFLRSDVKRQPTRSVHEPGSVPNGRG